MDATPLSSPRLTLRPVRQDELPQVLRLYQDTPAYFQLALGTAEVTAEDVAEWFAEARGDPRRHFWGLYLPPEQAMVGVADFVVGYPTPREVFLGLLLVASPWQGKGLGAEAVRLLEAHFFRLPGIRQVRLGVLREDRRAREFWRRLGYVLDRVQRDQRGRPLLVYRKPWARGGA